MFPTVWTRLATLVAEGRLMAPREVLHELDAYEGKKEEPRRWTQRHRAIFKALDVEQQKHVHEILAKFPDLVDVSKATPDADPFVIALALAEGATVATSELGRGAHAKPHIPDACAGFGLECVGLLEWFRRLGWTF